MAGVQIHDAINPKDDQPRTAHAVLACASLMPIQPRVACRSSLVRSVNPCSL